MAQYKTVTYKLKSGGTATRQVKESSFSQPSTSSSSSRTAGEIIRASREKGGTWESVKGEVSKPTPTVSPPLKPALLGVESLPSVKYGSTLRRPGLSEPSLTPSMTTQEESKSPGFWSGSISSSVGQIGSTLRGTKTKLEAAGIEHKGISTVSGIATRAETGVGQASKFNPMLRATGRDIALAGGIVAAAGLAPTTVGGIAAVVGTQQLAVKGTRAVTYVQSSPFQRSLIKDTKKMEQSQSVIRQAEQRRFWQPRTSKHEKQSEFAVRSYWQAQGLAGGKLAEATAISQQLRKTGLAGELIALPALSIQSELFGKALTTKAGLAGKTITGRYRGVKTFWEFAKPIGKAGFAEGVATELAYSESRYIPKSFKRVSIAGGVGAVSAGLIGGTIASVSVTRPKLSKAILAGAYIADPYEPVGDVLAKVASKTTSRVLKIPVITPAITFSPTTTTITTISTPTTIKTTTKVPASIFANVPTTIPASTLTAITTPVSTTIPTTTFTPTSILTSIPATVPSIVPTITPTITSTPTAVPIVVPVFKFPLIPIPLPGGGGGGGSFFGARRLRRVAKYQPSLFAKAFNITSMKAPMYSAGLGIRPMISAPKLNIPGFTKKRKRRRR